MFAILLYCDIFAVSILSKIDYHDVNCIQDVVSNYLYDVKSFLYQRLGVPCIVCILESPIGTL